MNTLSDIITYCRRIVKTPSNASLSDSLIIDYINRFVISDIDPRIQLFDFKTKYQFETIPGICDYNMPLYSTQSSTLQSAISPYPVYQGVMGPCYANGIQMPFYTERDGFWKIWPNYAQTLPQAGTGDGTTGPYALTAPYFPAIPGHLDMSGIVAASQFSGTVQDPIFDNVFPVDVSGNITIPTTSFHPMVRINYTDEDGNNRTITDSGVFLSGVNGGDLYGLLIEPGLPPLGNRPLGGGAGVYSTTQNTVNYRTGQINVTFPNAVPQDTPIQVQSYFYQPGLPRAVLFYNNTITIRPPPNTQYLIELDAYLTPAAFLSLSQAVQFGYMSEYIARGAARKILSDTGDIEQFMFYEPLFREQEILVWKRSQRIKTSTRTPTIFSQFSGPQSPNSTGLGAL